MPCLLMVRPQGTPVPGTAIGRAFLEGHARVLRIVLCVRKRPMRTRTFFSPSLPMRCRQSLAPAPAPMQTASVAEATTPVMPRQQALTLAAGSDRTPQALSQPGPTAKVVVLMQHLCSRTPDRIEYRTTVAQVRTGATPAQRDLPVLADQRALGEARAGGARHLCGCAAGASAGFGRVAEHVWAACQGPISRHGPRRRRCAARACGDRTGDAVGTAAGPRPRACARQDAQRAGAGAGRTIVGPSRRRACDAPLGRRGHHLGPHRHFAYVPCTLVCRFRTLRLTRGVGGRCTATGPLAWLPRRVGDEKSVVRKAALQARRLGGHYR
jgi:hypothetical protein